VSDLLTMNAGELQRAEVMHHLKEKRITQRQAAQQLGVSVRQIKRLWRAYRAAGAKTLVSKRRGRASNHQLAPRVKAQVLDLVRDATWTSGRRWHMRS